MNSTNPVNTVPPDQISPKEVISRVVQFKNVFLRSWKTILICVAIGAIIGFIIDLNQDKRPIYTATITFNMGGGSSSGGMGNLGDLAGMFGLSGSAPDASIFTGENFLYYVLSRPLITRALMKEVVMPENKKKALMVNYYIEKSGIRDDEWEEDDTLRNFRFVPKKIDDFTDLEYRALDQVYTRITGETAVFQKDRKSSFLTLRTGLHSDKLAKTWVEVLLATVQEDYTEKQTKKTREMYDLMVRRADSLQRMLSSNENRLAQYIDQNQQVVVAAGQAQQNKMTRNNTFLQSLYYQAMQSVENIRLSLIKEAPLFTIIEPVSMPLYKEAKKPYAMKAGIILGLIVGLTIIFLRQAYVSIMQQR